MSVFHRRNGLKRSGDCAAIFVHAGAGYHSIQNESIHLQACNEGSAALAAMSLLRNGGTAVEAVEMAIKVLEDREITNAGYGSNLAIDGTVEGDAIVVDHLGRSGGVGAVAQIKNPISLARILLDQTTQELSLRRVPPNLLVGQGATDFAFEQGLPILPNDALVSPTARERWYRWKEDMKAAERKLRDKQQNHSDIHIYPPGDELPSADEEHIRLSLLVDHSKALRAGVWNEGQPTSPPPPRTDESESATPSKMTSINSNQAWDTAGTPQLSRDGLGLPVQMRSREKSQEIEGVQDLIELHERFVTGRPSEVTGNQPPIRFDKEWLQGSLASWHDGNCILDEYDLSESILQLPSVAPKLTTPPLIKKKDHTIEEAADDKPEDKTSESASSPSSLCLTGSPRTCKENGGRDLINDTVGAIAIDAQGHIACGASSGGIGMKFRGRVGPAALVGVGAAVVPMNPEDRMGTCTGTVTSGTGEHLGTTLAANVCAERLYHGLRKQRTGDYESCEDDEAIRSMIENDFMGTCM